MNHLGELGGEVLAAVSRSFYLTIRFLPHELREPITLAYLLARTSDTIADEAAAPVSLRLEHLDIFRESLTEIADRHRLDRLTHEIIPKHTGERMLLGKVQQCLLWLDQLSAPDKAEIVAVLQKIIGGQALDLKRFGDPAHLSALRTAAELDEYTYLVAGCVGEFWTRLSFQHLASYSGSSLDEMTRLGINFGKGLQLVNVMRDLPSDLRAGRCYLPATELEALGLTPASLLASPTLARSIFFGWLEKARSHLDDGFHYIRRVTNARVRFACTLPWHLGMKTLAMLEAHPSLETAHRVKATRFDVYSIMARAPFAALSNTLLDELRGATLSEGKTSAASR